MPPRICAGSFPRRSRSKTRGGADALPAFRNAERKVRPLSRSVGPSCGSSGAERGWRPGTDGSPNTKRSSDRVPRRHRGLRGRAAAPAGRVRLRPRGAHRPRLAAGDPERQGMGRVNRRFPLQRLQLGGAQGLSRGPGFSRAPGALPRGHRRASVRPAGAARARSSPGAQRRPRRPRGLQPGPPRHRLLAFDPRRHPLPHLRQHSQAPVRGRALRLVPDHRRRRRRGRTLRPLGAARRRGRSLRRARGPGERQRARRLGGPPVLAHRRQRRRRRRGGSRPGSKPRRGRRRSDSPWGTPWSGSAAARRSPSCSPSCPTWRTIPATSVWRP